MTWVAGGKHLFCARAISDVKITLEMNKNDIRYFDGVRKSHFIGQNMAVSFAGSIRLALKIIESLQQEFYPRLKDGMFQAPSVIMHKARRCIIHHYNKHKVDENERVEFLVFIVATNLNISTEMWKIVSPKFTPIQPTKPFEVLELGSGATAPEFRKLVKECSVGYYEVHHEDRKKDLIIPVGNVGMRYLFAQAIDYEKAGISRAMHIMLAYPYNMTIENLPEKPDGEFPHVASTWDEVKSIIKAQGITLKDCYAYA